MWNMNQQVFVWKYSYHRALIHPKENQDWPELTFMYIYSGKYASATQYELQSSLKDCCWSVSFSSTVLDKHNTWWLLHFVFNVLSHSISCEGRGKQCGWCHIMLYHTKYYLEEVRKGHGVAAVLCLPCRNTIQGTKAALSVQVSVNHILLMIDGLYMVHKILVQ